MIKLLLIFSITFLISFAGSFHPGPLNMSVIQKTLKKNLSAGLWMTFGGVIPEIIYGYLAVEGLKIFERYPLVFEIMQWIVLPILLLVGWNYLKPKPAKDQIEEILGANKLSAESEIASLSSDIFKGFLLSFLNPQLLPFWLIILINYQNYQVLHIENMLDKTAFVVGASAGAFLLNYFCAYIANRKRGLVFEYLSPKMFDTIMGWTFVVIALIQAIKLLTF
jgi:threonine/homoserine/homoserine lactone efflux protein